MGRNGSATEAIAALDMFPKLLEVPISTYLIVFAKMRRPSMTPSASAQVLVEEERVGRVFGDVGSGVDRDSDVCLMQREGVVDTVAEETH